MEIDHLIQNYQEIIKCYEENQKTEAKDFNVFDFMSEIFGLGETKHSRIIAFLLNPDAPHGQGKLFLNLFLERLELKNYEDDHWKVYAEKGNADVLIQSTYPIRKTIIIENKSNWAEDQSNQLYRYWHNHIYLFHNRDCIKSRDKTINRIIYLSPHENKYFEEHSLCKPEKGYEECPEKKVPIKIDNWFFRSEFRDWLYECLKNLDKHSQKISLFITDYINYWEATNFKHETIMNGLEEHFTNKQTWTDLKEILSKKQQTKINWIENFQAKLKSLSESSGWKFYQQNYGDFRIYPSDNWGICFVYEYEKGLSIWKEGITIEQKEKIKEDLIGSISDFHFIDNEFHNNTTYVMAFNQNQELMFKDEDEFAWEANNTNLFDTIANILKPHLNEETRKMFLEINNKLE